MGDCCSSSVWYSPLFADCRREDTSNHGTFDDKAYDHEYSADDLPFGGMAPGERLRPGVPEPPNWTEFDSTAGYSYPQLQPVDGINFASQYLIPGQPNDGSLYRQPQPAQSNVVAAANNPDQLVCHEVDCSCENRPFTKANQFKRHRDTVSGKFTCKTPACASPCKAFGSSNDLQRHTRERHGKELDGSTATAYPCPDSKCHRHREVFWRKANLKAHIRTKHDGINLPEASVRAPISAVHGPGIRIGPHLQAARVNAQGAVPGSGIGHRRAREESPDSGSEEGSPSDSEDTTDQYSKRKLRQIYYQREQALLHQKRLEAQEQVLRLDAEYEALRGKYRRRRKTAARATKKQKVAPHGVNS